MSKYAWPLIIVPEGGCPLFGRNWLRVIRLDWKSLGLNYIGPGSGPTHATASSPMFKCLDDVLEHYSSLFDSKLGCYTGPPVKFTVHTEPKFHKARPVPYAIQKLVKDALLKLEDDGIIKRITTASCATPIVPVAKSDNKVRICGDFSMTFNPCAEVVTYPIPKYKGSPCSIERLHSVFHS